MVVYVAIFLTINNFINIGTYISANGILAAGLTVAMLLGGLDLSHMAVMALGGMALGILYEQGYPQWCLFHVQF